MEEVFGDREGPFPLRVDDDGAFLLPDPDGGADKIAKGLAVAPDDGDLAPVLAVVEVEGGGIGSRLGLSWHSHTSNVR